MSSCLTQLNRVLVEAIYIFINYRKQKEKYSRVRNQSVENTSRKKRAKGQERNTRGETTWEKHTQAHLIQDFPSRQAATCISRSNASSSAGEAGLADRCARTGRININAHDSIFEACAEQGCTPLEGDTVFGTVFENPREHHFPGHFSVLQRDELDSAESARRHLTEVGKDARSHPGGAGAFTRLHIVGRSIHHTLVFGVFDCLVCRDGGPGRQNQQRHCYPCLRVRRVQRETAAARRRGSGQAGGRRGVDNANVDPQLGRQ